MSVHTVIVGEARPASGVRPSAGPVIRCIYAKDGLLELPNSMESPWQFFSDSARRNPNKSMLGRRQAVGSEAGPYEWQTYEEVYNAAVRVGAAMRNRGVNPGDRCGIYGTNCPEWIIAMEACNSQSICYVPLYDTLGSDSIEFIMKHAELSTIFVQETKIPSVISCLRRSIFYLKNVISLGEISGMERKELEEDLGASCFTWKEFVQLGNLDCEILPKQRSDVCTIMYTSGTTGEPKGVILTNEAIMSETLSVDRLLHETDKVVTEDDTYFSFLPLAHIFDQIIETYCIYKGASIGFWRGDVRHLMEDIRALRPSIFCGVPRVYERICDGMRRKISSQGALGRALFHFAYNRKLKNLERGFPQHQASPIFDKLIFNAIKQGLGGRIRLLLSGAAPLPRHTEEFLRVVTCSVFSQGYGLTETCGGCFTSLVNTFSMIGTVGVPMPTIEARLESVPEMGYDALSVVAPPRGEICVRGNSLFSGYYRRDDITSEVIVDGWFHTGDIGEAQADGSLKIIDRKKNIFKLSQGEYVSPETVEGVYLRSPIITMVWVYGRSLESFLVAVVVPDEVAVRKWATENRLDGDFKSLCGDLRVRKYVLDTLNGTREKRELRGFEIVRGVHLEAVPFDVERDLLTPTFKLKRRQLLNYYKDRIEQLYAEVKGARV